jgi:hypothetical protein
VVAINHILEAFFILQARIDVLSEDESMLYSLESGQYVAGMDSVMPDPEDLDQLDHEQVDVRLGNREAVSTEKEEEDYLPTGTDLPSLGTGEDEESEEEQNLAG